MITKESFPRTGVSRIAFPALLAFTLLVPLLPLPRAYTTSNHTWRVELGAAVLLSALIAVAGRAVLTVEPQLLKRVLSLFGIFALWSLVSGFWAGSTASVLHHSLLWGEYLILLCVTVRGIRNGPSPVLFGAYLLVAVIAVVCVLDYLTLPDFHASEGDLRIRYGVYGELLVTIVPLLWAAAMYRRRTSGWLVLMVPAILGWIAAMLSLSKGVFIAGTIGFALMFVGWLIFASRMWRRRTLATAAVWLVVTIVVQSVGASLLSVPASVDYISGRADTKRETSLARVFIWRVGATMARSHWLIGVGADNFGLHFNEARAELRTAHPDDPPVEVNADVIAERAHNEPLQVFAELGLVGLVLFFLPFIVVVAAVIRQIVRRARLSPLLWASLAGMTAFGVSSLVSSFSFRASQNGVVLFVVLAVAIVELSKGKRYDAARAIPTGFVVPVLAAALLVFALKCAAEISFAAGDRTRDPEAAKPAYGLAGKLDPDYAAAELRMYDRDSRSDNFRGAAIHLREAIMNGMGQVVTYSRLAACYEKSGDTAMAESAFRESLAIFPRSIFLKVRYGFFLARLGRSEDAERQFAEARDVDRRHANGWYSLLSRGSVTSYLDATHGGDLAPPDELTPPSAVVLYLDKLPAEQPQ